MVIRRKKKRQIIIAFLIRTLIVLFLGFAVQLPLLLWFLREPEPALQPEQPKPTEPTVSCDLTKPWYEQYSVVTHALGTVDGRVGTNSKEAFEQSYENGARVFEADLTLTADGYLVARHDFTSTSFWSLEQTMNENMYYADFMNAKIGYFYTPLDIDDLLALMKEYPDTYLVTDTKADDKHSVEETFRRFEEALGRANDESLRERIIIQFYNYEMYEWVKDFVPRENYIFTVYQMEERDYTSLAEFCRENSVPVLTMPEQDVEENIALLKESGLRVYVHTLNKISDMIELYGVWEVDGFYSDYITPDNYESVKKLKDTEEADKLTYGEY